VQFRKDGFETHYTLPENHRIKRWVKAFALGENGEELGVSNGLDVADQITMWYVHGPVEDAVDEAEVGETEQHDSPADGYYSFAGIAVATFGLCGMLVLVLLLGYYAARTRGMRMNEDTSNARVKSFVDEERAAFLGPEHAGEEMMSSTGRGHALEP
jgi:hypothetical protein